MMFDLMSVMCVIHYKILGNNGWEQETQYLPCIYLQLELFLLFNLRYC